MDAADLVDTLPVDIANFDDVANIFYDKTDQRYHYEDERTELVFDGGGWKRSKIAYDSNGDEGQYNIERDSEDNVSSDNNKKREADDEKTNAMQLRLRKKQKLRDIKQLQKVYRQTNNRKNSCVYVSGLPLDVSSEELEAVFGKYGLLAEDLVNRGKRIKIYKDSNGAVKGDALVQYFKHESVELAVSLLDGTSIRQGDDTKIKVEPAEFKNSSSRNIEEGSHVVDEKKLKQKSLMKKKLSEKLIDWDDDELIKEDNKRKYLKRYEKTVVIENCFKKDGLDEESIQELEEDMELECSKLGVILRIIVCDQEENGIILIKFKEKKSADLCVEMLDGRFFDGAKLHAFIHDGKPYRKSSKRRSATEGSDDDDDTRRLKEYEHFLEQ